MDTFNSSSTKLNEQQNPNDFIVVWTPSTNVPSELNSFSDYFVKFELNEAAHNHIASSKSERKVLLILTDFESLGRFENLTQIQSIYVFENEHRNNQIEKNDHPKLIGIYDNIRDLIDRLRKDISLIDRNDLPISFSSIKEIKMERSLTNLHGFLLPFLWNQIFFYYLLKFPATSMEELKKEMLKQCRLEYQDDRIELLKIDDFDQTCSFQSALNWYTKDSFLYRLLNKVFRTRDAELISKFQYYIILLHQRFQDLSKEQHECPSCVYRGQSVDESTLRTLQSNIGHLISINTIMSTTSDKDIARVFAYGAENAVIFQINIRSQTAKRSKPFLDISPFSSMPGEKEFLFFLGTVFSIDSIRQEPDGTWFIELTLHNEIWKHIKKLTPIFLQYISTPEICLDLFMKTDDFNMIDRYYWMLTGEKFSLKNNPTTMIYIYVAFSRSNLGLYKNAIQFYETAIRQGNFSIDSPEFRVLYMIIGYLYFHSREYDNAFLYYGIVLSLLSETNLLASELYTHIGDVWKESRNEDIALSCYHRALQIARYRDIPSLPNIYQSIIDIKKTQGSLDEVYVYEKQKEEIDYNQYHISTRRLDDEIFLERQMQLENDSSLTMIQRGNLLYTMGLCLFKKGQYSEALETLLKAKDLFLKEPPSWGRFRQHLPALFDNIAFLHLRNNDYFKALIMWKKSIELRNNFPLR